MSAVGIRKLVSFGGTLRVLLEPAGVTHRELVCGLLTLNRDLFSRVSVIACKIDTFILYVYVDFKNNYKDLLKGLQE